MTDARARRPAPADLALGSTWRSAVRLSAYFLFTGVAIPLQAALLAANSRFAVDFPRSYHSVCCRLLSIRVVRRGTISTARPTLFVSNHSSYLDITVLGSIIPGSFVAKAEVASWPFFGLLAKLQRTVFVDRRQRTTHRQRDDLSRRLAAGDSLILFPEGTSNDGNRTLPFRSALFSVAEQRDSEGKATDSPLVVQPVSFAYARLNGMPIGRTLRPLFAWYGDMDLFGHLWRVAGLGRIEVAMDFHPPVTLAEFGTRKALSEHCHRTVATGVARALTGRHDELPAPSGQYPSAADAARLPATAT